MRWKNKKLNTKRGRKNDKYFKGIRAYFRGLCTDCEGRTSGVNWLTRWHYPLGKGQEGEAPVQIRVSPLDERLEITVDALFQGM